MEFYGKNRRMDFSFVQYFKIVNGSSRRVRDRLAEEGFNSNVYVLFENIFGGRIFDWSFVL